MSQITYPHLCAGVFIRILVTYMKEGGSAAEHYNGIRDDVTQLSIAEQLILLVMPELPDKAMNTRNRHISQLVNCREHSRPQSSFPYYDANYVNGLRSKMKTEEFFSDWCNFLEWCIGIDEESKYKCESIIKSLLEIIEHDSSFPGCRCGEYMTRDYLLGNPTVPFQQFLLEVWSFICENAPDNQIDRDLYESWVAGHTGRFGGHVVNVEYNQPIEKPCGVRTAMIEDTLETTRNEDSAEAVEAEIVEGIPHERSAEEKLRENGIVMNNFGSGPQIGIMNGNIIINSH